MTGLEEQYTSAMRKVATGVTVVGTGGRTEWLAQTVSAMCSVSAHPPLVLVCLNDRSPVNEAIGVNGMFSVSVLTTRHDHVADTFAGRPWPGKDRHDFTCGVWEAAPSGSPRLADALAAFDCTVESSTRAGSHLVHIGRVQHVTHREGDPLVYADRTYGRPEPVVLQQFPGYPPFPPETNVRNERR